MIVPSSSRATSSATSPARAGSVRFTDVHPPRDEGDTLTRADHGTSKGRWRPHGPRSGTIGTSGSPAAGGGSSNTVGAGPGRSGGGAGGGGARGARARGAAL